MNHPTRSMLCALVLAAAAGAAHADLLPAPTPSKSLASVDLGALITTGPRAESLGDDISDSFEGIDSLESRKFALASNSLSLPAAAAPSLWSFVTAVQAQQRGDSFVQLETHLSLVQQVTAPTQVPLPAPLWLLVMGTLGVAGTRLSQRRRQAAGMSGAPSALQPA